MLHTTEHIKHLKDWPIELIPLRLSGKQNGNFERWYNAYDSLPDLNVTNVFFGDTVTIEGETRDEQSLVDGLKGLLPWRKGPFRFANVLVDTEWRSDLKWSRVMSSKAIRQALEGASVLDVGCGNGYFGWRMLKAGAQSVIGIDPSALFCLQHQCVERYVQDKRNTVLPFKLEELPTTVQFNCVFSMGVIYHRRDPIDHLIRLYDQTSSSGLLILETLIHDQKTSLYPDGRYARMGNVWCVPSESDLFSWIEKAGYKDPTKVDITKTTTQEQRATEWMSFESLANALNPNNPQLTIEGYQAPIRELIIARKE